MIRRPCAVSCAASWTSPAWKLGPTSKLATASRRSPHFVPSGWTWFLTDINMPGMDGEELLLEVRNDPMLSAIPVLVVSTDRSEGRVRHMLSLGADGYVSKPFLPATLSQEMYRLLGGAPR